MLKRPKNEMEAAIGAAVAGIQQDLDEARRAAARKVKSRQLIMQTDAEDAAITAAAMGDPDNQPPKDEQLAEFRPARRGRGRPTKDMTKVLVSIRFDAAVLSAFKATGEGWQTRMNDALMEYAQQHDMLS